MADQPEAMADQPEAMVEDAEVKVEENQDEEMPVVIEEVKQDPKKTLLMSKVVSLKKQMDKIVELAEAELGVKEDLSNICTEVRKLKHLADGFLSTANRKGKQAKDAAGKLQCQYVAKIQGLRQQHFKDMRNILQNALGLGTVKFSPPLRNSAFVEINFTTEELMNKALKIVRNKPLGLTLCVVETRKVDKSTLAPENVLDSVAAEFDPIIMQRESLQRSRELTEEEHNKMLEWKEKFIRHVLTKMCEKLDPEIFTVVKDRTEGYFFKLEDIRSTVMATTASERYQTYSGVNPETGKLEMGYWGLGCDIPSRIPRSECIRDTLKVLTDFMESSDKPLYDLRVRKGFWDSIMIRANHVGECMAVLVVHSESVTEATKECEALTPLLVDLFEKGDGADCGLKSIHIKALTESAKGGNWFHVLGEESLDEEVAGLKLRLYKNTFFWGDGGCTEQLCQTVAEELGLEDDAGVLELGIATGLICMYLAKRCKMVVGLDRVQSVLPMARKNVELNDLENIELVQSGPTTSVPSLKTKFKECDDVHAVITETSSNARSKFNKGKDEVLGIRKATWIKKVAYLVISYKDVTSTLKLLCTKTADSSEPFVITKIIPFDVASTSVRPDILLLLERPSALEGLTEKRVPKKKLSQVAGPPAKKVKLSPGVQAGGQQRQAGGQQRQRTLLPVGRKFGSAPLLQGNNRNFGNRNFNQNRTNAGYSQQNTGYMQQNTGFPQQRQQMFPWAQDNRNRMMQYDGGAMNSMRAAAAAEEEAMLLERVRRQKEAQLQHMQEAAYEAQRRRFNDNNTTNIEEVVLSAIKKTGLLDKVSALTETTSKLQGDMGNDRWSGNYNQRGSDDRSSMNMSTPVRNTSGGFQNQDSFGYQGRGSGFQNMDMRGDSNFNSGSGSFYQNSGYSNPYSSR